MTDGSISVPVVLASASSERQRLLRELLSEFEVREARREQRQGLDGGQPEAVAVRRAEVKAADVAEQRSESLIIAADTVVECADRLLGKPQDREEAADMLRLLTSHPQRVVTGVCLLTPAGLRLDRVEAATVEMRSFSEEEVEQYVETHDVCEWAGAYALRHDDPNVTRLDGSSCTVRGLPLERLEEGLSALYPGWTGGLPNETSVEPG